MAICGRRCVLLPCGSDVLVVLGRSAVLGPLRLLLTSNNQTSVDVVQHKITHCSLNNVRSAIHLMIAEPPSVICGQLIGTSAANSFSFF